MSLFDNKERCGNFVRWATAIISRVNARRTLILRLEDPSFLNSIPSCDWPSDPHGRVLSIMCSGEKPRSERDPYLSFGENANFLFSSLFVFQRPYARIEHPRKNPTAWGRINTSNMLVWEIMTSLRW